MISGTRRRDRPKTTCLSNITSWTGLGLEELLQKISDRQALKMRIWLAVGLGLGLEVGVVKALCNQLLD